ncbi:MAG: CcmD family protein [Ferruginibacter sp.]
MYKYKVLITRFTILLASMFVSTFSLAQAKEVEMADTMRSNGKIYIVVAVCLTILVGLFLYIFSLDRKLSKAEKEV